MAVPHNLASAHPRLRGAAVSARRHARLVLCASLFLLALALRLYRIGAQSLWLDEGSTWAEITGRTGKGWLALLGELFSPDAAYPLYHVLLKAWVSLAGDSEWALRFPSALAGAAAVAAIYFAAAELAQPPANANLPSPIPHSPFPIPHSPFPIIAALLLAASPFALWYAQDAKVYSLLMLVIALELWALLRALRRGDRRSWLLVIAVTATSLFVHRLALLAAAGAALAYVVAAHPVTHTRQRALRWAAGIAALVLSGAGVVGTILAVRNDPQGAGGHIPADPLQGLWLTITHFSLDRDDIAGFLGLPLAVWALPFIALTLWGLVLLARDAARRRNAAVAILCMFIVPLALFAIALAFAHVYEPRYTTIAFPAWVLVLAYPFIPNPHAAPRRPAAIAARLPLIAYGLLCAMFLIDVLVLFQPKHGIFSGDPVKEQWRDAVTYLAQRVHPDDMVIVHPYYVAPLYDYYAPRVTADQLPQPTIFWIFAEGYRQDFKDFVRRRYEPDFQKEARGKKRMLLLIAPDHARTIDPPINPPRDTYGWVGLRFQYPQNTWPCGGSGDAFIGVEVMCQSFPEYAAFGAGGAIPQPAIERRAAFGGELQLRGYSLDLFGGVARPGGTLPITLYWEALAPPTHDYSMFLHLCRDCTIPPLANDDGPPLGGYGDAGRTTTWRVGDPLHDERALVLPPDLPPGRYTLLLGVYPAGDPSAAARLPVVSQAEVFDHTRLVLGEVVVTK